MADIYVCSTCGDTDHDHRPPCEPYRCETCRAPFWNSLDKVNHERDCRFGRLRAIRAVVAAQWIAACMLVARQHPDGTLLMRVSGHVLSGFCATPEQIVDGGEPAPVVRP